MLSAKMDMSLEDYAYVSMDLSRSELPVLWPDSRDEYEGSSPPDFGDGGAPPHLSSLTLTLVQPDSQNLHRPSAKLCPEMLCARACRHSGHAWWAANLQVPVRGRSGLLRACLLCSKQEPGAQVSGV